MALGPKCSRLAKYLSSWRFARNFDLACFFTFRCSLILYEINPQRICITRFLTFFPLFERTHPVPRFILHPSFEFIAIFKFEAELAVLHPTGSQLLC